MRRIYLVLLILLGAFLLMQFFRPEKNPGDPGRETDFLKVSTVPDTLAAIFLNSCYDCHSEITRYPWYSRIAPVSWYLNNHIVEGKAHLNFTTWGILEKAQKISLLSEICDESESGTMPLRGYLLIHGDAKLGPDEIEAICEWAESEAMKILTGD
jgi:hypothetical protein